MAPNTQNTENKSHDNQDNQLFLICCVKNCNTKIKPGTEIKIEGEIYCPACAAIVFKNSLGL